MQAREGKAPKEDSVAKKPAKKAKKKAKPAAMKSMK
jgi:hypothetical protein